MKNANEAHAELGCRTLLVKYRQNGSQIYCGKTCVAKIMFKSGDTELRILQGMSRAETVEKIKSDVPTFLKEFGIPDNHYPKLFTQAHQDAIMA